MTDTKRRVVNLEASGKPGSLVAVGLGLEEPGQERTYTVDGQEGLTLADIERLWPDAEVFFFELVWESEPEEK